MIRAHIKYLKYIYFHKLYVFQACMKWKVPLWRAIIHDYSKFFPSEWGPYVRAFHNPDGSKRNIKTDSNTIDMNKISAEFAVAWNSHQKRNPHHWQWWVVLNDEDGMVALEMPDTYIREMLADWEGAGKAITGNADARGWYIRQYDKFIMHPNTRKAIEEYLNIVQVYVQNYEITSGGKITQSGKRTWLMM